MSYPGKRGSPRYNKKLRAVPKILPREPLTKKARAAILAYATFRANSRRGSWSSHFMVNYVLEAERMPRARLYEFLAKHNYKWKSGTWHRPKIVKETRSNAISSPEQPLSVAVFGKVQ